MKKTNPNMVEQGIQEMGQNTQNEFKVIPESVAEKIVEAIQKKGVTLSYNPKSKFSAEKDSFATFPQLKILLEKYQDELHKNINNNVNKYLDWFSEGEQKIKLKNFKTFNNEDWKNFFTTTIQLEKEEKDELNTNHQTRIQNFAHKVQEERLPTETLRTLKSKNNQDAFPQLTALLLQDKIKPLEYEKLLAYYTESEALLKQEAEILKIIEQGKIKDFLEELLPEAGANNTAKILEANLTDELIAIINAKQITTHFATIISTKIRQEIIAADEVIKIMKKWQTNGLICMMKEKYTDELIKVMIAWQTNNLIKIMKEGQINNLSRIIDKRQTDEVIKIMKAEQTDEVIKIMKEGQTDELIKIMENWQTNNLIKVMKEGLSDKLIKAMNEWQTDELIKAMRWETNNLIKIMKNWQTDNLVQIMKNW